MTTCVNHDDRNGTHEVPTWGWDSPLIWFCCECASCDGTTFDTCERSQ